MANGKAKTKVDWKQTDWELLAVLAATAAAGVVLVYQALQWSFKLGVGVLLLLLFVGLLRWVLGSWIRCRKTPARLLVVIAALAGFWAVFFLLLVPGLSKGEGGEATVVEALEKTALPALATTVEAYNDQQKGYLVVAVSLPLLIFIFGAGPLSQSGSAAAPASTPKIDAQAAPVLPPPVPPATSEAPAGPAEAGESSSSGATAGKTSGDSTTPTDSDKTEG